VSSCSDEGMRVCSLKCKPTDTAGTRLCPITADQVHVLMRNQGTWPSIVIRFGQTFYHTLDMGIESSEVGQPMR